MEVNLRWFHIWLAYFGMFALSWSCWTMAASLQGSIDDVWVRILLYAGGTGPLLITVIFTFWLYNSKQRKAFWSRLFSWSGLSLKWVVIFLIIPFLVAFISSFLAGEFIKQDLSRNISSPSYLLILLLIAPVVEEPAWRGFALDSLQRKMTVLKASLIVGLLWTVWHLPLFYIEGTYQNALGINTTSFWYFNITTLVVSFLYAWIYNQSSRSILAVILFHFSINLSGELFASSVYSKFLSLILYVIILMYVIIHSMSYKNTTNLKLAEKKLPDEGT